VRSDFAVLTSALSIVPSSAQSTVGEIDRCSVATPDNPVNFSGVALRKPKSGQFAHGTVSGAPLVAPNLVCSKIYRIPSIFFFVCLY
jgi:hypothetical protein